MIDKEGYKFPGLDHATVLLLTSRNFNDIYKKVFLNCIHANFFFLQYEKSIPMIA